MRKSRAFTLIELTVVLAVLAIAFAIAAPRQSSAAAAYRLDLTAKRIAEDIRLAELDAWHSGRSREIVFDVVNDRYEIVGMTDARGEPYVVHLAEEPYRVALVGADFGGTNKITLDGRGTGIVSGTLGIEVGSRSMTATVSASGLDGNGDTVKIVTSLLN